MTTSSSGKICVFGVGIHAQIVRHIVLFEGIVRPTSGTMMLPRLGMHIGFRPAFEIQNPDALGSNKVVTVGTLYMDGRPVRVPEKPVLNGDIWSYVPGSKLELRPALEDPAYQVRAIKAGNTLIADRTLLKYASWNDIQMALDNEGRSYLVLNWKNFIFQKSPKS